MIRCHRRRWRPHYPTPATTVPSDHITHHFTDTTASSMFTASGFVTDIGSKSSRVDLRIVPLNQLFLSCLDPEDGGVVFSVLPHIIEYQPRLARSTKTLDCENAGVDRVLCTIV
jgi:hypothetical protein